MGNETASATRQQDEPEGLSLGALVEGRGQRWIVGEVDAGESSTLVTLPSTEDGRYGDTLADISEVEPGRRVLPSGSLPEVTTRRFDPPERLAAFLDAAVGPRRLRRMLGCCRRRSGQARTSRTTSSSQSLARSKRLR